MDLAAEKKLWSEGYSLVAGVDEAGRGPLAGPVVAAAVILQLPVTSNQCPVKDLNDSKKLSEKKREKLFEEINRNAYSVGIGIVDNEIIDMSNILEAALLAMRRAVFVLKEPPRYILIDGLQSPFPPEYSVPQEPVVKGDSLIASIAAASIIAKVTRDRIMRAHALEYPGYGFEVHKGYPTKDHIRALGKLGPCPIHRKTFGPVMTVSSGQYPVASLK